MGYLIAQDSYASTITILNFKTRAGLGSVSGQAQTTTTGSKENWTMCATSSSK